MLRLGASLVALAVVASSCSSPDASSVGGPVSATATGAPRAGGPVSATAPDAASVGGPVSTSATGAATTEVAVVVPDGFERVAATVTTEAGETCELCLWLADTASLRARGLMGVTDLGDADGMAFLYPEPHTGSFWMKDTVLPLSIAFFAADGSYLDDFDMEPCVTDRCASYPTSPDFIVAIETTRGGLDPLGIGPGSTLRLSELPCGS